MAWSDEARRKAAETRKRNALARGKKTFEQALKQKDAAARNKMGLQRKPATKASSAKAKTALSGINASPLPNHKQLMKQASKTFRNTVQKIGGRVFVNGWPQATKAENRVMFAKPKK